MKHAIPLFFLLLFFSSCQQTPQNISEEHSKTVEEQEVAQKQPVKYQPASSKHPTTSNKVQQELQTLQDATKGMIVQHEAIPSFHIDAEEQLVQQILAARNTLNCAENVKYAKMNRFDLQFIEAYENSSTQTQLVDGAAFCLSNLDLPNTSLSKIVYQRAEGGNLSDQVLMNTINDASNKCHTLLLCYKTGRDGYEIVVESTINGTMVTRKITERFGWSNLHPDSLALQPRREVEQQIKVQSNGAMEVVAEEVQKYNIEELFR